MNAIKHGQCVLCREEGEGSDYGWLFFSEPMFVCRRCTNLVSFIDSQMFYRLRDLEAEVRSFSKRLDRLEGK